MLERSLSSDNIFIFTESYREVGVLLKVLYILIRRYHRLNKDLCSRVFVEIFVHMSVYPYVCEHIDGRVYTYKNISHNSHLYYFIKRSFSRRNCAQSQPGPTLFPSTHTLTLCRLLSVLLFVKEAFS